MKCFYVKLMEMRMGKINSQHCNNDLHEEMLILLKRFDDICCCHGI